MGGRIVLQSVPGLGTEVLLDLPLEPAEAAGDVGVVAAQGAAPARVAGAPRVLVVDDDAVSRLLMAEMLRQRGFAVVEAAHVRGALARWAEGGLDAVISDHQMPDGSGLAMLQQMAAGQPSAGPRVRLVLCSGSPPEVDLAQSGIDAVLRKPVTAELLAITLARLMAVATA